MSETGSTCRRKEFRLPVGRGVHLSEEGVDLSEEVHLSEEMSF